MPEVVTKLLELLTPKERFRFYLLVGVLIVTAALEVIGIASVMPFMAVVTNPDVIHTNRWLNWAYESLGFSTDRAFLIALGLLMLAFLVLSNGFKAATTWFRIRFLYQMNYRLSRRMMAQYMARPYSYFLNHNTTNLGKNILSEVGNVTSGLMGPITQFTASLLVSLAIISLLVFVSPGAALAVVVVLGGAYALVYGMTRRKLAVLGQQRARTNEKKFKIAREAFGGIKDLKVTGRETTFLNEFSRNAKRWGQIHVHVRLISNMPRYVLEVVAFGGILGVALYLVFMDREAHELIALLALYAFAGYRLLPALQQVFLAATEIRFGLPALEILHRDMVQGGQHAPAEDSLVRSRDVPTMPFRKALTLEGVSFEYEGASTPALKNINFAIPANTTVGFVGPTGSGKTTMVDLILGLLIPTQGRIMADDTPLTPDNLASWQKNIGYVPQHIYISDDTVTRNIAFGVPDNKIDQAAVRRAARIANLEEFIDRELDHGFDTVIGEQGIRLSGGQRQRIGIARALYTDPLVLVMDEATSALDGITEEHVMEAVHRLARQKTIILIAHRLTTVRDCDIIFLLERGTIRKQGTHAELMRESEWFRAAAAGKSEIPA